MKRLAAAWQLLRRHFVNASGSLEGLVSLSARLVRILRTGEWRAILARHEAIAELYRDYPRWFEAGTARDATAAMELGAAIGARPDRPLISVLMPTRNADARWLAAAIESVRAQLYSNWQLCIVDDGSTEEEGPRCAAAFARDDPRIELQRLGNPAGIAPATTTALAMAKGTLVAFLDHDDLLTPDALLLVADAFVKEPRLRMVYTDEDKIDLAGNLYWPVFKPAWNPDLLLANNYITHLVAVETALARSLGGIRSGFEGAQDWDFVLRATEALDAAEIGHIPRVVYHWRAARGSMASHADAKNYVIDAQRRVLEDAVERRGLCANVVRYPYCWRLKRQLTDEPLVSIVIPLRNRADLLRQCLDAIAAHTVYRNYELVLVDNGSDEADVLELLEKLARSARHRVVRVPGAFNFARLANRGVDAAQGSVVVLLNNDAMPFDDEWLVELAVQAIRPEVGAVGAALFYPDGTIQHIGIVLGLNGPSDHIFRGMPGDWSGINGRAQSMQDLTAVTGACVAFRRALYLEIGGMDEALAVSLNDTDFCLRLRARGYRVVHTPYARLLHRESASRGYDHRAAQLALRQGEELRFNARWREWIEDDPAYNPNLAREGRSFALGEWVGLEAVTARRTLQAPETNVGGCKVGRVPPEIVDRMRNRRSRILAGIDIENCRGLEFGPLDKPLVRRDDGEVLYADYASTDALRVKSSGDALVDIDAIVDVDHVIDRSDFSSTLAPRGPFDYVVASHVFEHIPDPLTWLEQLRAVLRPGGRICLAVPDRRHTFDFYRRETTVGDLLAFRLERLVRPSLVQLCDHYLHVAVIDTGASWRVDFSQKEPSLHHPWSQVELILNQHLAGLYIDCHCTVWTHHSFERVIPSALERAAIRGLRLSTVQAPLPDTNEFIVQLVAV